MRCGLTQFQFGDRNAQPDPHRLPAIFTAVLILILAYSGALVSDLVTNIPASLGFNNIFSLHWPATC